MREENWDFSSQYVELYLSPSALKRAVDACYKSTVFLQESQLLIFFYSVHVFLWLETKKLFQGGNKTLNIINYCFIFFLQPKGDSI